MFECLANSFALLCITVLEHIHLKKPIMAKEMEPSFLMMCGVLVMKLT